MIASRDGVGQAVQPFTFLGPGPDGLRYQGLLHVPAGTGPFPAVVISHPHSAYGGSMEVPLVRRIAEEMAEHGIVALRFNFRGVGGSQGTSTNGEGEMVDLLGALEVANRLPQVASGRLGLVGYSFGAWIGMLVAACDEIPLRGLVAITLPLWQAGIDWQPAISCPKLFISGDRDGLCPLADLQAFLHKLPPPAELQVIPYADHFFCHREAEVARLVVEFWIRYLCTAS